jgi:hypothetical protein
MCINRPSLSLGTHLFTPKPFLHTDSDFRGVQAQDSGGVGPVAVRLPEAGDNPTCRQPPIPSSVLLVDGLDVKASG